MKPKKVTKKMIDSSFYQIVCTCGCDIETGHIGKCHECGQEWEMK